MTHELNVTVRGGRGAGKTTLLRTIAAYLHMRGMGVVVNDEAEQITVTLYESDLDALVTERINRERAHAKVRNLSATVSP